MGPRFVGVVLYCMHGRLFTHAGEGAVIGAERPSTHLLIRPWCLAGCWNDPSNGIVGILLVPELRKSSSERDDNSWREGTCSVLYSAPVTEVNLSVCIKPRGLTSPPRHQPALSSYRRCLSDKAWSKTHQEGIASTAYTMFCGARAMPKTRGHADELFQRPTSSNSRRFHAIIANHS